MINNFVGKYHRARTVFEIEGWGYRNFVQAVVILVVDIT